MTMTIVNRTLGPMCKVARKPVAKLSEFERIKQLSAKRLFS